VRFSFASVDTVARAAGRTAVRFPLPLAAAAVAAVAAVLIIQETGPAEPYVRLLASATLGFPLGVALALWGEARGLGTAARTVLILAGVAVLVGFWLAWPGWSEPVSLARYVQLAVAFHLLAAFLPFAGRPERRAFWEYNRTLLLRFVIAGITSAILFVGLALALLALDTLFGLSVPARLYPQLMAVLGFVFQTWFFLGGIPSLAALDQPREYPAPLRVLAQYTLVPLVSLYLVILTVYLGKVIVTWDWPSGAIGWLVSAVAGAGILALLLVHPVAGDPAQRWVATFARTFWIAILPAVAMLWMALYQRVNQYGLTVIRYWAIALSLWLAGVALYYIVTRSRGIRLIPASLCVVALATFVGPWGAYGMARRSQQTRLQMLIEAHRQEGDTLAVRGHAREISAVTRYLVTWHGPSALRPPLPGREDLTGGPPPAQGAGRVDSVARTLVTALEVTYIPFVPEPAHGVWQSAQAPADAIPVAGYEWLIPVTTREGEAGRGFEAAFDAPAQRVRVTRDGSAVLEVSLAPLIERLAAARRTSPEVALADSLFVVEAASGPWHALVRLASVRWRETDEGSTEVSVSGSVLLRRAADP
jgi:hypothetical protein